MTDHPTLARVLEALDDAYDGGMCEAACEDAAALLREMAADFDRYGYTHRPRCYYVPELPDACTCGLDNARLRWRLPR